MGVVLGSDMPMSSEVTPMAGPSVAVNVPVSCGSGLETQNKED